MLAISEVKSGKACNISTFSSVGSFSSISEGIMKDDLGASGASSWSMILATASEANGAHGNV